MATVDEMLDALLKDCKKPEDIVGENGLLKQLTKRVLERAMQAEMTNHLGYEKHSLDGNNSGNSRNGSYKKTVKGEFGTLDVSVPRDRNGTFDPIILPKGQSRFTGFDDKIISMYARGMTTRDIQSHLQEMYGVGRQGDVPEGGRGTSLGRQGDVPEILRNSSQAPSVCLNQLFTTLCSSYHTRFRELDVSTHRFSSHSQFADRPVAQQAPCLHRRCLLSRFPYLGSINLQYLAYSQG